MKSGERNKTAVKGLNWRFSSRWSSRICKLPYIFIRTILTSSMLYENTRKSLNLQIWVWLISNIDFRKFRDRVVKRAVTFCRPLLVAVFSRGLIAELTR